MNTDPAKPIGFRTTADTTRRCSSFCEGGHSIGWRFWIGPLLVARTPQRRRVSWWSARGAGWTDMPRSYSLTVLGVSISWSMR